MFHLPSKPKLTGYIAISVGGLQLSVEEKKLLTAGAVIAVVLFSRNFENPIQLKGLVNDIRQQKHNCLIFVDHEGQNLSSSCREGVWRFDDKVNFPPPPSHHQIGMMYQMDAEQGKRQAFSAGRIIGLQLVDYGIIPLGPVLCVDPQALQPPYPRKNKSSLHPTVLDGVDVEAGVGSRKRKASSCVDFGSWVISGLGRGFSSNSQDVQILADYWTQGVISAGLLPVGKHFPCHGWADGDTHDGVAKDVRCIEDILGQLDIVWRPFFANKQLSVVMTNHVIYPNSGDPVRPAGLSAYWMQEVLRKRLGFTGVTISDCFSMGAMDKLNLISSIVNASNNGCDIVLVCNKDADYYEALLNDVEHSPEPAVVERVTCLQGHLNLLAPSQEITP